MSTTTSTAPKFGQLAREWCKVQLELQVLRSAAGYYIGTFGEDGPCSRESQEYFDTFEEGKAALASGEWTQRSHP